MQQNEHVINLGIGDGSVPISSSLDIETVRECVNASLINQGKELLDVLSNVPKFQRTNIYQSFSLVYELAPDSEQSFTAQVSDAYVTLALHGASILGVPLEMGFVTICEEAIM